MSLSDKQFVAAVQAALAVDYDTAALTGDIILAIELDYRKDGASRPTPAQLAAYIIKNYPRALKPKPTAPPVDAAQAGDAGGSAAPPAPTAESAADAAQPGTNTDAGTPTDPEGFKPKKLGF